MPTKRPPGDFVQVSAWIPRSHKKLLEAIGGPSEALREQILKKGGKKAKLLLEKEEVLRQIEEQNARLRAIDEALSEMESEEELLRQRHEEEKRQKKERENARRRANTTYRR